MNTRVASNPGTTSCAFVPSRTHMNISSKFSAEFPSTCKLAGIVPNSVPIGCAPGVSVAIPLTEWIGPSPRESCWYKVDTSGMPPLRRYSLMSVPPNLISPKIKGNGSPSLRVLLMPENE